MGVHSQYLSNLETMRNEIRAAAATMKALPKPVFDRLNEEAEKATFECRNYGGGQFYCWLHHPAITKPLDPWPASRFPKSMACVEIARALNI